RLVLGGLRLRPDVLGRGRHRRGDDTGGRRGALAAFAAALRRERADAAPAAAGRGRPALPAGRRRAVLRGPARARAGGRVRPLPRVRARVRVLRPAGPAGRPAGAGARVVRPVDARLIVAREALIDEVDLSADGELVVY